MIDRMISARIAKAVNRGELTLAQAGILPASSRARARAASQTPFLSRKRGVRVLE